MNKTTAYQNMDFENIEQLLNKKFGNSITRSGDVVEFLKSIGQNPSKFMVDIRSKYSIAHGKLCFGSHPVEVQIEEDIEESEHEIEKRLNLRFNALNVMATATAKGINRSLVISGPAGLGKSHGVEKAAELHAGDFAHIKGYIRPTGLYKTLYANRHKGALVVFDDADSLWSDEVSLNLLKAACDTTDVRRLSWLSNAVMETEEGESIPSSFVFDGSVIFITNIDFQMHIDKGSRLAPHFEALMSRSHVLDLGIKNKRDYIVRIKQVLRQGMLDEKLVPDEKNEIIWFIEDNVEKMRELSLRMVKKLADLMLMDRSGWKDLARITCMKQ